MLILTGSLGLLQALFLPGFLVARLAGARGLARTLALAMAASLVLNLGIAALLVATGLWRRECWLAIFAIELAAVAWLVARGRRGGIRAPVSVPAAPWRLAEFAAGLAVAALALWYAGRVARAGAGVFTGWDDVASWNRWALDWAEGRFPGHTWNYPQAVPVAWAITYAFMGTDEVQSFARGMMPLFGLGAMVALARGGGRDRLAGLAAAWFAGTFLARVNNVTAGLADLPVAFLAAVALSELPRPGEPPDAARSPRRAALLAGGAALVKQAGLAVAAVVPVLAALASPRGRRLRGALAGWGLAALVALPWYALKQAEIAAGRETSEVLHVLTGAHGGLGPWERAAAGFARLSGLAGGPLVLLALLALGLLGLRDRAARPVVLLLALPFTLAWALGFSYDPRNLSVALVGWAVGCGAGLAALAGARRGPPLPWVEGAAARARAVAVPALAAMLVATLAAGALRVPDAALLERQRELRRGLGDPGVAGALHDLRVAGALEGLGVADPGVLLAYAPGWRERVIVADPSDPGGFAAALARPGVRWLVAPPDAAPGAMSGWRLERALGARVLWRRDGVAGGGP